LFASSGFRVFLSLVTAGAPGFFDQVVVAFQIRRHASAIAHASV
jgi:hypothetical protein